MKRYIKPILVILVVLVAFLLLQKSVSVDRIFQAGGIIGLALTVFAETGLLVGFFLPGDTLLFTAGFFAGQGKLSVAVSIIALFLGAVLGNMLGYEIGRRSGPKLFNRPDSVFFHKDNVDKAQAFFEKHGGKTVILARFIPIVRTLASPLAGMSNMSYAKFMTYNVIGALLWVPVMTLLGFWAGKVLGRYINIDRYVLPAVLLATFLTFGISFIHIWRDEVSREKLKSKLRRR